MTRPIDTLELIKNTKRKINPNYNAKIREIDAIYSSSIDKIQLILNAFTFGYAQGVKAQKRNKAYKK